MAATDCRRSLSKTDPVTDTLVELVSRSLESSVADWLAAVESRSDMMQDSFFTAEDFLFFFLTDAKSQLGPSSIGMSIICSRMLSDKDDDWLGETALLVEGPGAEMLSLVNPMGVMESPSRT